MPQYVRAFVPGGTFFFTLTLLERLGKLMMLTKGGMRYAFPPYGLRATCYGLIKKPYFFVIASTAISGNSFIVKSINFSIKANALSSAGFS